MVQTAPSENLQRVGFLALVPGLLGSFGVAPSKILLSAGLSTHALDNPENTIPYAAAARLLQASALETKCSYFGIKLGQLIRTSTLGPVGELMRHAPTLGEALRDFADHQHRNAHGGLMYLVKDRHKAAFGYAVYQPNVPGFDVICDTAAMASLGLVRELAGAQHDSNLEVLFSRSEPPDLEPYHRSLGVALRFNCEQTAVLLPRNLLDPPITGANAASRLEAETRVRGLWHAGPFDLVTQLRRAIRVGLIRGDVGAQEISAQLGLERRTLDRRLQVENAAFQEILDETRCELVKQLLRNTKLSIGEIATLVGYASPGVLTRSFNRWTGAGPSIWRESNQAS